MKVSFPLHGILVDSEDMMKKKISVIGANSYIGRNLTSVILKKSELYDIFLYDRNENQVDGISNYKCIDILSADSVKNINFDVDIIYMFVGKTGSANGFQDFQSFIDINELALLNILTEYVRQKSTAKIVFPSTRLVYKGKHGSLDENAEKESKTIYAVNKWACEKYLEIYHRVFGVNYIILRLCVPYGTLVPGAFSYGTAEFMLKQAMRGQNITLYGDGSPRRTLTYMGDLCDILLEAALSPIIKNDVYNIGGEDYSLKDMAELIALKYQVAVEMVEWPELSKKIESGDTVFNSLKLDNLLHIQYKETFERWINGNE